MILKKEVFKKWLSAVEFQNFETSKKKIEPQIKTSSDAFCLETTLTLH